MAMGTDDDRRLADAAAGRRSGRQIKNHDGISSDAWCSPPVVTNGLRDFFGRPVDVDPCSNERSLVWALRHLTIGGLVLPWDEITYANWPYSQNDAWSHKAVAEMKARRVSELVILCMTATSTRWWQSLMLEPKRNPRVLLTKRLKFLGPDGLPVDSSRFEPALIYYGSKSAKFDRTFRHVTMWSTWGR